MAQCNEKSVYYKSGPSMTSHIYKSLSNGSDYESKQTAQQTQLGCSVPTSALAFSSVNCDYFQLPRALKEAEAEKFFKYMDRMAEKSLPPISPSAETLFYEETESEYSDSEYSVTSTEEYSNQTHREDRGVSTTRAPIFPSSAQCGSSGSKYSEASTKEFLPEKQK